MVPRGKSFAKEQLLKDLKLKVNRKSASTVKRKWQHQITEMHETDMKIPAEHHNGLMTDPCLGHK